MPQKKYVTYIGELRGLESQEILSCFTCFELLYLFWVAWIGWVTWVAPFVCLLNNQFPMLSLFPRKRATGRSTWEHLLGILENALFLCFGQDLTQIIGEAEKQNGALVHFARFWRHLLRAFSSTFAKLSNLVEPIGKRGWAVGCNFWENIRDLLPVAGEHIPWNGRKCYFCRKIYFLFNFVSFQEASCITYQLPKQLEALSVNILGVG